MKRRLPARLDGQHAARDVSHDLQRMKVKDHGVRQMTFCDTMMWIEEEVAGAGAPFTDRFGMSRPSEGTVASLL